MSVSVTPRFALSTFFLYADVPKRGNIAVELFWSTLLFRKKLICTWKMINMAPEKVFPGT